MVWSRLKLVLSTTSQPAPAKSALARAWWMPGINPASAIDVSTSLVVRRVLRARTTLTSGCSRILILGG